VDETKKKKDDKRESDRDECIRNKRKLFVRILLRKLLVRQKAETEENKTIKKTQTAASAIRVSVPIIFIRAGRPGSSSL
jgi:hypothetical protein